MQAQQELERNASFSDDVAMGDCSFEDYQPEIKSTPEITEALIELMGSFESFKQANNTRLGELEKRGAADVITEEKLARINRGLDEQQQRIDTLAKTAGRISADDQHMEQKQAHRQAFEGYIRKGEEKGFLKLDRKTLSVGSDEDGGYLVPEETERTIGRALTMLSPVRAISAQRRISSGSYKRPFAINGAGFGWVGETSARPETATPQLAELAFPAMELYAMPAATMTLLEDAAVDIDQWLADEVHMAFAVAEGAAFIAGDGVNKPKGFLNYPAVNNSAWIWGSLVAINTGVDGAFEADAPADSLIDLIYALKSPYRVNARFVMNRLTQAEVRKLKDVEGNYLWQPSNARGESPTLMGYPVIEAEDMPDIAADSLSIAFGDFKRGYLVVDRSGTRVLRDRYSAKPYVLFYTTKRVGGGVQDFNAIKLMRFKA